MIGRVLARRVSCLVVAATVVGLGGLSLARLPVSLLPPVAPPQVEVSIEIPGMEREEVLQKITQVVEGRLMGVPNAAAVRSTTQSGGARFVLESTWQTDPDRLHVDVTHRLDAINRVPGARVLTEVVSGDPLPLLEIGVFGGSSDAARAAWVRGVLVPELAQLEGAGRVELVGQRPLHVTVVPRLAELVARGLTVVDLVSRLEVLGVPESVGRVRDGALVRPMVIQENVDSLEALRQLRLGGEAEIVFLKDVADLRVSPLEGGGRFERDGREGTLVRVYRSPRSNIVMLAHAVRQRLAELQLGAPTALEVEVVDDRSGEVVAAVGRLASGALLGLLLGALGLRWALGSWWAAVALVVVVPAAIVASFTLFLVGGVPLDLLALGGLALAVGLLVDNSIVVVESIAVARARGDSAATARVVGTSEVAVALVASLAATTVILLPIIYLEGLPRVFFGVQSLAIVGTLLLSLAFSLAVTPLIAAGSRLGGSNLGRPTYERLLQRALAAPKRSAALALLLVVAGAFAAGQLPRRLLPQPKAAAFDIRYALPAGWQPEREAAGARKLVSNIRDVAEQARVLWTHWPEQATPRREGEAGIIRVEFPTSAAAAVALPALQAALASWPLGRAEIAPRPTVVAQAVSQTDRGLELMVLAEGAAESQGLISQVAASLEEMGVPTHRDSAQASKPAWRIHWDARVLAEVGSSRTALNAQLAATGEIRRLGRVGLPGVEPELLLLPPVDVPLGIVPVLVGEGARERSVPLGALAQLEEEMERPPLLRYDGRPASSLLVDRKHLETGHLVAGDRLRQLTELVQVGGGELRLAGAGSEVRRSFSQLRLSLAVSLVLLFLTIAAIYESFTVPALVLSGIPVALAGAALTLAATGQSLNLMSFLGLILLGGLVVNNSIVLLDRAGRLRRQDGLLWCDAVLLAAHERYRPVVLTTMTTVVGLLPLAIFGGAGVELRRSLATTVIGGMLAGLVGSLLVLPLLATWRFRSRNPARDEVGSEP